MALFSSKIKERVYYWIRVGAKGNKIQQFDEIIEVVDYMKPLMPSKGSFQPVAKLYLECGPYREAESIALYVGYANQKYDRSLTSAEIATLNYDIFGQASNQISLTIDDVLVDLLGTIQNLESEEITTLYNALSERQIQYSGNQLWEVTLGTQ